MGTSAVLGLPGRTGSSSRTRNHDTAVV